MSTVEKIDVNKYKLTFSVDAERFEEGLAYSYNKNKGYFNIEGFRKGKAPRKIVEARYGKEVLYDDAINFVLQDAYTAALDESKLDVVSRPEVNVTEVSTENGVTFEAEVYVKPEVKISDYKGLSYKKVDIEVTDEDVEAELNKDREKHSRIIDVKDRAIENGDIATIDFEGFIDGVAFEGGKGTDYDLEIGSHSFIDTFEDQLVGKNVGDDVDVNVTFPAEYGQKDLAGKPALFKVEIKDIKAKELPEINDEFVQDTTEFESVDEYKKDIRAKLILAKTDAAEKAKEEELVDALIEKAEMDVPQAMIENEIDNKINEFRNGISRQGLSIEMYLQYMGQSMENMREAYRIISEKQVKARLALEAVAANENFEVSDEEIDAELTRIAETYGMEKEKIQSIFGEKEKEGIVKDLQVQKALKFVMENAVEA